VSELISIVTLEILSSASLTVFSIFSAASFIDPKSGLPDLSSTISARLRRLLSWIRRRLRAIILHQWKTTKKLNRVLRRTGWKEKVNMRMNKWRSSHSKAANYAIPNRFFEEMNLVDMTKYHHPLSKFPILDP
jgi:hypothetical protein